MAILWGSYEPYIPIHKGLPSGWGRKAAKEEFQHLMVARPVRTVELLELLRLNGVQYDGSDAALALLEEWLMANAEGDSENPGRLLPEWYAIVNDVGLVVGDTLIERHPSLAWSLCLLGRRYSAYQRHIIVGFTKAADSRYFLELDLPIAGYAQSAASGADRSGGWLLKMVRYAEALV